ncbi:MAG: TRAP transporter small permease subunit [Chloroflexaceae bacterium]|nr:TRAP transporter small permease subunit [Chloroflexaceae bacterium]
MNALLKVSRGIDAVVDFMGRYLGWLVLIMILVGVYNTATRYIGSVMGRSLASNTLIEAQWYMFSILFFLGASYVLKHNEHVRVDVFYGNWPPKRKALVNIIGTLLFLIPFCIVVIWVSTQPVLISWGMNRRTGVIDLARMEWSDQPGGLPRAPIKSMILIGFGLLAIQGISELIKNIAVLMGKLQSTEKTLEEQFAQGSLLQQQAPGESPAR